LLIQAITGTGSDTAALNRTRKTSSETNDYKRTLTITDTREEKGGLAVSIIMIMIHNDSTNVK